MYVADLTGHLYTQARRTRRARPHARFMQQGCGVLAFLQFLCAYNEGAAVHRLPSSSDGVTMEEFDGKGEWKGGEKEEPIDGEEDEGAGPRFAHAGGPQCAQQ